MMKHLLMLLALLLPLNAQAQDRELQVSLLFAPGQPQITFTLNNQETRQFWLRWNELEATTNMVPLALETDYRGLRIRTQDDREVRLFGGVGTMGQNARLDDMRMLERWLLAKAPTDPGERLIAQLDALVDQTDASRAAPQRDAPTAGKIIQGCRQRAENSKRLRARCLADALLQYREPDEAIKALQQAIQSSEKVKPAPKDSTAPPPVSQTLPPLPEGKTIHMPRDGEAIEQQGKVIIMPVEPQAEHKLY